MVLNIWIFTPEDTVRVSYIVWSTLKCPRETDNSVDTNIQQRIGEIFQLAARQQWKIRNRRKQKKRGYCDTMKTI